MLRYVAVLLLGLLAHGSLIFGASSEGEKIKPLDCETRPAWCERGYVCQPTACAAESAAQLGLLMAELDAARARRWRRFHADLACGAGVASALVAHQTPDGDYGGMDLDWFPSPGACVFGLAFRLGK